jgi:hypothetical protein
MQADLREPRVRQGRGDLVGLMAAQFQEHVAAGAEPCRRRGGCSCQHRRPARPPVQRQPRLVVAHVSRQEMELLRRHVRDHRRQDVDASAHRVRERLVEVAQEGANPVPPSAVHRDRVDVRADHGRLLVGRPHDDRHRSAAGAQVHCGPAGRQEGSGSPRQRLGVRPWHEDAGGDADPDPAEAHPTDDPGQRFPAQPAGQQIVDRSLPIAGCREECEGLGARGDATPVPQRTNSVVNNASDRSSKISHRVDPGARRPTGPPPGRSPRSARHRPAVRDCPRADRRTG